MRTTATIVPLSLDILVRDIKITQHLADTEVDEDSDATFTCEINYADEELQWLLNDKLLCTNEVNTITHEGKAHKLTLKNLAPQDGGTISIQVRKVKESATLKVKGENHMLAVLSIFRVFSIYREKLPGWNDSWMAMFYSSYFFNGVNNCCGKVT